MVKSLKDVLTSSNHRGPELEEEVRRFISHDEEGEYPVGISKRSFGKGIDLNSLRNKK